MAQGARYPAAPRREADTSDTGALREVSIARNRVYRGAPRESAGDIPPRAVCARWQEGAREEAARERGRCKWFRGRGSGAGGGAVGASALPGLSGSNERAGRDV